jgi:hypothetical protein
MLAASNSIRFQLISRDLSFPEVIPISLFVFPKIPGTNFNSKTFSSVFILYYDFYLRNLFLFFLELKLNTCQISERIGVVLVSFFLKLLNL